MINREINEIENGENIISSVTAKAKRGENINGNKRLCSSWQRSYEESSYVAA